LAEVEIMGYGENTSAEIERVAAAIVDSAFKVHSRLGPGLLESVYAVCLTHELRSRGFTVGRELRVPVLYEGIKLHTGFKMDLLVNDSVIIELKAVEEMRPLYKAQLLTYLRLTDKRLGLLINFNVPLIKDGIKRVAN
jgi:GxxExxY protein